MQLEQFGGLKTPIDACSPYSEGLLIANQTTLQQLIFAAGAPHSALVNHIWAHMAIDGNICQTQRRKTTRCWRY